MSSANERLRGCLGAAGWTVQQVAVAAEVDPKTVERWVSNGRLPQARYRAIVADRLGVQQTYLWPQLLDDSKARSASAAEFAALFPQRSAVPADLWRKLIADAAEQIDILVYAGLFLPDGYPDLGRALAYKADCGVVVRVALGDPASSAVAIRGEEEGIGAGLASRIQLSNMYLADAFAHEGVAVREHATTLYNSLFRFDDQLLVNCHAYGAPAARSPVLHLRRVPGGQLFDHYVQSFERVWEQSRSGDDSIDDQDEKVS